MVSANLQFQKLNKSIYIYTHMKLNHFAIHRKLTQHCKAALFQFLKENEKRILPVWLSFSLMKFTSFLFYFLLHIHKYDFLEVHWYDHSGVVPSTVFPIFLILHRFLSFPPSLLVIHVNYLGFFSVYTSLPAYTVICKQLSLYVHVAENMHFCFIRMRSYFTDISMACLSHATITYGNPFQSPDMGLILFSLMATLYYMRCTFHNFFTIALMTGVHFLPAFTQLMLF